MHWCTTSTANIKVPSSCVVPPACSIRAAPSLKPQRVFPGAQINLKTEYFPQHATCEKRTTVESDSSEVFRSSCVKTATEMQLNDWPVGDGGLTAFSCRVLSEFIRHSKQWGNKRYSFRSPHDSHAVKTTANYVLCPTKAPKANTVCALNMP